jgi:plastocyanin
MGVLMLRLIPWCLAIAVFVPAAAARAVIDVPGAVRAGARPLKNAVVWLESPSAGSGTSAKAVLNQTHLSFQPEVLAIRVGTTVRFPNNDTVLHNVFSFRDGKKFDLGIYPVGASKEVKFDNAGLSRIFCNIHSNMAAYILAVDSPYFAVSDESGQFTLRGVPEGSYTYRAWRASGPDLTGTVSVATGKRLEIVWP